MGLVLEKKRRRVAARPSGRWALSVAPTARARGPQGDGLMIDPGWCLRPARNRATIPGMRILIVDDDAVTRLHLEFLSRSFGYEVVSAADVAAAWQHLADRSIRIVLADWWMPGIEGPEFCRQIRQRGGPYVYFILVTNQPDSPENYAATLSAGVDDYMHKPVQPDDLKLRLISAVRTLQKMDEASVGA